MRIEFGDIYGVSLEVPAPDSQEAILHIHSFAHETIRAKNCCGCSKSKKLRQRVVRQTSLLCATQTASEWHRRMLWGLAKLPYEHDRDPVKPKLLVLSNPFGGAGAARGNWQLVEPLFQKAHVEYQLVETQYAGHAKEIVRDQLVPGQYDVIVTVSGDGLIHEIVNGLVNRRDWNKFRDTVTIGVVPGGSGNGLAKSLLHRHNENYGVMEAALRVLKDRVVYVDLTELTLEY